MIVVDTSVWIDFFRGDGQELIELLQENKVVTHWIVIGELSTGNLPKRAQTLADLRALEQLPEATPRESLALVENQKLFGKGLSWGDIQLLASCLIHSLPLWTRDKRLSEVARRLNASWD